MAPWARVWWGQAASTAVVAFGVTMVFLGVSVAVNANASSPVALPMASAAQACVLGALTSASLAIPVATVAGALAATRRWVDEGALAALAVSGIAGRRLLGPAASFGAAGAALTLAWGLEAEPAMRRWLRAELARAAVEAPWAPGMEVRLPGFAGATVIGTDEVAFAAPDFVGVARRSRDGGAQWALVDGEWRGTASPGWSLRFERWVPEPPPSRRVELDERGTSELPAVIRRREARGEGAEYERCILGKRWLHPLAALFGTVAAIPWAVRWSPVAVGAAWVACYWLAVRSGDSLASVLGGWLAAAAGPASLAAFAVVGWLSWRER